MMAKELEAQLNASEYFKDAQSGDLGSRHQNDARILAQAIEDVGTYEDYEVSPKAENALKRLQNLST